MPKADQLLNVPPRVCRHIGFTVGHFSKQSRPVALAASVGQMSAADADRQAIELPANHCEAVKHRRCRIVVQYDCQTEFDLDFDSWIAYRFAYADEPGTQIDALWWDMGRLGNVFYPSKLLNRLENRSLERWRRQGIDLVGRLVEETKKRKLEIFWHHRVSEVDLDSEGAGAAWKSGPDPLKRVHPDWVLKTWWKHGLWNFAVPQVRQLTVESLREVVGRYDFDGVQIDFSRHIPCLPPGRQWELRHHVTESDCARPGRCCWRRRVGAAGRSCLPPRCRKPLKAAVLTG